MRSRSIVASGLLGPAALTVLSCAAPPRPQATGQTKPVAVDASCTGDSVSVKVDPWRRSLSEGDDVAWNLTGDADSLEINNTTSGGRWPYDSRPPYKGNKTTPARGNQMKSGQKGKEFRYSVSIFCHTPTAARKIVIDPDMVVY